MEGIMGRNKSAGRGTTTAPTGMSPAAFAADIARRLNERFRGGGQNLNAVNVFGEQVPTPQLTPAPASATDFEGLPPIDVVFNGIQRLEDSIRNGVIPNTSNWENAFTSGVPIDASTRGVSPPELREEITRLGGGNYNEGNRRAEAFIERLNDLDGLTKDSKKSVGQSARELRKYGYSEETVKALPKIASFLRINANFMNDPSRNPAAQREVYNQLSSYLMRGLIPSGRGTVTFAPFTRQEADSLIERYVSQARSVQGLLPDSANDGIFSVPSFANDSSNTLSRGLGNAVRNMTAPARSAYGDSVAARVLADHFRNLSRNR